MSNIRYLICEGVPDHIFTATGKRNLKIPNEAREKYVSKITVTAQRKAVTSGRKG